MLVLSWQASISRVSGIGFLNELTQDVILYKGEDFCGRRNGSRNIFRSLAEVFFGYFVIIMAN